MILAVPPPFAVTRPLALTVATAALSLIHVTVLSAASEGDTVAVNCKVSSSVSDAFVLLRVIDVGFTASFTEMEQVAFFPLPSFALQVIVAVPADFAVTRPLDDTVITDVSSEAQLTLLLVAEVG